MCPCACAKAGQCNVYHCFVTPVCALLRNLFSFHHSLVLILFCQDVYLSHLPLYFPRSRSEEDFTAYHLPEDVGNDTGEPVIEERQIRIVGKPTHRTQGTPPTCYTDVYRIQLYLRFKTPPFNSSINFNTGHK